MRRAVRPTRPAIELLESRLFLSTHTGAIGGHVLEIPTVMSPPFGPLVGWNVFLDINRNGRPDRGEPSATTDSAGDYLLTGLRPGRYRVAPVFPPGWAPTPGTLGSKLIRIRNGETEQPIDFAAALVLSGVSASLLMPGPNAIGAGSRARVFLQLDNQADGALLNGKFEIALAASTMSVVQTTTKLTTTTRFIHLAAARSRKFLLVFRIPATLPAGDYSLSATLIPHGASGIEPIATLASQPIHVTMARPRR